MSIAVYRDPTFEKVLAMQVRERKCGVCDKGKEVFEGEFYCTMSLRFPSCKSEKNGFKMLDQ